MRRTLPALCIAVSMAAFGSPEAPPHNYKPKQGYVPDQTTAIKIALAVWSPIYGEAKIAAQAPYIAKLSSGVWVVTGSLPRGAVGGVAVAEIAKEDGKILRVSHGK